MSVDTELVAELDRIVSAEAVDESETVDVRPARVARLSWRSWLAYAVLPGLLLIIALSAGYLKWWDGSARLAQVAAAESVQAATDGTIAMLSYRPDTVDADLGAAAGRLTGAFRDQYRQLVADVVAPGAKQRRITAAATVPAAGSVAAGGQHAVVLVLVNQTTTIGDDPPTSTASSVRVTLDKVDNRWLISQFDPV